MALQAHSDGALVWSSIFFIMFGVLRLAATSGIVFLRDWAAPLVPLEYVFLAIGVFLFIYGWLGAFRLALIMAGLSLLGYYIITTGAFV